jgi:hypothetical protein
MKAGPFFKEKTGSSNENFLSEFNLSCLESHIVFIGDALEDDYWCISLDREEWKYIQRGGDSLGDLIKRLCWGEHPAPNAWESILSLLDHFIAR